MFSFGKEGTDASEYRLSNLTGSLYFNTCDPEYARLEMIVPQEAENNARWALGFDPQLHTPPLDIHLSVKFTVPSGLSVWFPNCIARASAGVMLRLEVYVHREPDGEGWWAKINGLKQVGDLSQPVAFSDRDIII